ncbi:dual specificity protein kinase Ttk [Anoplophora glabripennis]|uniref:dual specificity protein kinase Ttk n=1 Tax=Anoplophora glabripennis TaxID=217634 RepID=UPI0008745DCE|nr:dual specificity protein kinase Ttk [Anoplophora glabripennis]
MSSTTADFSEMRKSTVIDEIYNRGAHTSVKKKPQKLMILKPLNLISIKKEIEEELEHYEQEILSTKVSGKEENQEVLTTIQEEDTEFQKSTLMKDVTNYPDSQSLKILSENNDKCLIEKPKNTLCLNSKASYMSQVKENINLQEQRNDSFDLDFSALSLLTPVKQNDNNISHTMNVIKPEQPREHFQHFITPKINTTLSKHQYSLSKKSFLKTPINIFNSNSARRLIGTPCKPEKISPTGLENQHDLKSEDKRNNSTISNYKIVTPSHKDTMKVSQTVLNSNNEDAPCSNPMNSLRDETFKRIRVNDIEYIIFNLLGKGGSSEVYQCYNVERKSHVAIKCVALDNSASANDFINEVKLLQRLQNCNKIIKMYDYEILETQKKMLVVLEKGGKDLSTILKQLAGQKSHIPMYMLLFYWMEMLYAVRQIHSNGIIHSDLKPANFLKVDEGLKLIDFGIASSVQTDMTSVIKTKQEGSCNYLSPEALNSDNTNFGSTNTEKYKIHYKSDVWSLGCILYQFVYRRTPFQHITQLWPKLAAIMNPEHEINYPHVDWVSPKIIGTIKKCLQYNVKSRPSVDELIVEYESILYSI